MSDAQNSVHGDLIYHCERCSVRWRQTAFNNIWRTCPAVMLTTRTIPTSRFRCRSLSAGSQRFWPHNSVPAPPTVNTVYVTWQLCFLYCCWCLASRFYKQLLATKWRVWLLSLCQGSFFQRVLLVIWDSNQAVSVMHSWIHLFVYHRSISNERYRTTLACKVSELHFPFLLLLFGRVLGFYSNEYLQRLEI